MSVFGLQDFNPFFVLQLSTDVMTINLPHAVDNLLPSRPHLICILFLNIIKNMMSQGTAKSLVLVIYVIYISGIAVTYPKISFAARYATSQSRTFYASSTHASLEVQL